MGNIMQQAKDRPVLSTIAASAVTLTAILGGAKALDIRLIPWATASEIEALKEEQELANAKLLRALNNIIERQNELSADQRALMRDFWQKRLEEAEEDLRLSPNSRSARAQRDEAKKNIELIDQVNAGVPHRSALPSDDK
jgi:hypothetical protein